jgi:hypothetical protein
MSIEQSAVRSEPTSEQLAWRELVASLKESIKSDARSLRLLKTDIRQLQRASSSNAAAVAQSRLSLERRQARARLLIYGFLRGHTWERMEPNHRLDGSLWSAIVYVWKTEAARFGCAFPEALKVELPGNYRMALP